MKKNIVILYGGRSTEHEISCRSAAFVFKNLNTDKYNVFAIAIDKGGLWHWQDMSLLRDKVGDFVPILGDKSAEEVSSKDFRDIASFINLRVAGALEGPFNPRSVVVIPMIHGTNGEDGTMQGFLEMADIAYVGCDHYASSVGMDKCFSKRLAQSSGVEVVPWVETRKPFFEKDAKKFMSEVIQKLSLPVFIKPSKLGSSVGISKAETEKELEEACLNAFRYDDKILVEKSIEAREIECAALGGYDPEISLAGEVVAHADFYTYEAKYLDENQSTIEVPAQISKTQMEEIRELSLLVYKALGLYGMSRIDFFLEKSTGQFYFNEVNTIPGFTSISQYPLLWENSGVNSEELLDKLIDLAIKRQGMWQSQQKSHN